jgi:hypothetical protein
VLASVFCSAGVVLLSQAERRRMEEKMKGGIRILVSTMLKK